MRDFSGSSHIHLLSPDLWIINDHHTRNEEMTCLFVDRYCGPREFRKLVIHDFWELIYTFEGTGVLKSDIDYPMEKHAAILIPPGLKHNEFSQDQLDTLWIGFQYPDKYFDKNKILKVKSEKLDASCQKLWLESQNLHNTNGLILDGMLTEIIGSTIQAYTSASSPSDCIDDAIKYLQDHYTNRFSMSFVANKIGYSHGHFFRVFKQRTGMTPMNYLIQLRVRQANKLLRHTSLSIKEIATMVGFSDPLYFSKVYRKFLGKPPSKTRK